MAGAAGAAGARFRTQDVFHVAACSAPGEAAARSAFLPRYSGSSTAPLFKCQVVRQSHHFGLPKAAGGPLGGRWQRVGLLDHLFISQYPFQSHVELSQRPAPSSAGEEEDGSERITSDADELEQPGRRENTILFGGIQLAPPHLQSFTSDFSTTGEKRLTADS